MNIINSLHALLVVTALVYTVFMFVFPFLIIGKLNTIIMNQNYIIKHMEINKE